MAKLHRWEEIVDEARTLENSTIDPQRALSLAQAVLVFDEELRRFDEELRRTVVSCPAPDVSSTRRAG